MSSIKKFRQILAFSGTQGGIYSVMVRSFLVYSVCRQRQAKCWVEGGRSQVSSFNIFWGIKIKKKGIIKLMIQHQEVELFQKLLQMPSLFQYRNEQI